MTMDPNRIGGLFMCVSEIITFEHPIEKEIYQVTIKPSDILMLMEVNGQMIYMFHLGKQKMLLLPCLKEEHFCLKQFRDEFEFNLLEELIRQKVLAFEF